MPFKLSMHINYQESSSRYQVAGIRCRVLGKRYLVSGNGRQFSIFNSQFSPFIALIILFSSCSSTKNTTYFQNIPKDTTLTNLVSKDFEPKIQKGDLLGITVASLSPENTIIYNAPQNAQGPLTGYLVDENGDIQFVKSGTLHVEGMTRKEIKDTLEKDLAPYLAQAVVAVGFLNRHITLMGGVTAQIIPMPNDNMTILDAIAASGGISDKGRPDNILVVREKGNSKEFKRLNLTDNSIFYSPYFYMQPNDIVYVEPVKEKKNQFFTIFSIVVSSVSLIFLVLNRFHL